MDKIIKALNELQTINSAHSLSNSSIEKLLSEAKTAKVCTPVIGKFSSGKSALLNTLLGYSRKILRENITPETAVPTEITYRPDVDHVCVFKNDGTSETITISDYRQLDVDANTVKCIRLDLKNSSLEKIPDVILVDMPGFESGFDVHNKAIDNYLPRSLAYIITFPADDMIVRSSIGNLLKELCLYEMPLCVAITKYDKRNDDFEETFAAMKESLKRFVGEREIQYCITSSYSGDAEELEEFLSGIQERSQDILASKFKNDVLTAADAAENYLKTTLKSSEMSESELNDQKSKLGKQLDTLNERFSNEKADFDLQISECVEEVKTDVEAALKAEEVNFIAMTMNNQSINDRMNTIVRNAVTVSIKKKFIPKIEKYLRRVTNCINGESIGDVQISFNFNMEDMSLAMTSSAVAAVAALIVAGPLIGGIIAGIIALASKLKSEKMREDAKSKIRMKLNSEVYPQVLKEIGNGLELELTKQIKLINASIEDEITTQRAALEKAMDDVRKKLSDENAQKEKLAADIKADLERIQMIRSEISA